MLEDISNSQHRTSKTSKGKKEIKPSSSNKRVTNGKENKLESARRSPTEIYEIKSHSFTNGSANRANRSKNKRGERTSKAMKFEYRRGREEDDELDVRYVNDIDSLVPPKFNPDTRTYFKLSIYSPSNRLYTVNEEANSTQSDIGAGEYQSSLMNSGYRISGGRSRVNQILSRRSVDKKERPSDTKHGESDEDNDDCNLSESDIIHQTPFPN